MKTAIRIDDISPAMDWEKFHAFRELLERYGVNPLIGVVPDNRDGNLNRGAENPEFWQYVKQLQESGWVVALHGYRHLYTEKKGGMFPLNGFSGCALRAAGGNAGTGQGNFGVPRNPDGYFHGAGPFL